MQFVGNQGNVVLAENRAQLSIRMRGQHGETSRSRDVDGRPDIIKATDQVVAAALSDVKLKLSVDGSGPLGNIGVAVIHVIPGNSTFDARLLEYVVMPALHYI